MKRIAIVLFLLCAGCAEDYGNSVKAEPDGSQPKLHEGAQVYTTADTGGHCYLQLKFANGDVYGEYVTFRVCSRQR
jgi:hypothetical protein